MNKGFHDLGKTNYFKSTRNRRTKNLMENIMVAELFPILKIVSNFELTSGVKEKNITNTVSD